MKPDISEKKHFLNFAKKADNVTWLMLIMFLKEPNPFYKNIDAETGQKVRTQMK